MESNNNNFDNNFLASTLNTLQEQIAIIKQNGEIVFVNEAWIKFGEENDGPKDFSWIGINYVDAFTNSHDTGNYIMLSKAKKELVRVLNFQKKESTIIYACDSPKISRWFAMRIAKIDLISPPLFMITHSDVSQQKKDHDESRTDILSGLANRRYFDEFLAKEWNRAKRSKSLVSCIMLDIDHFKRLNDKYGHQVGDQCIENVGVILKMFSRREGDIAARIGGEEFAIVVSNQIEEEVFNLAEIIRNEIGQLQILHKSENITVSCGIACLYPSKELDPKKLISMADAAMYKAKRNGRNQSILNSSSNPFEMV